MKEISAWVKKLSSLLSKLIKLCFISLKNLLPFRMFLNKIKTRGPQATGRSPEWHSHCRYADVMQHFSNPVIATNEKIII